eukprot:1667256-Amphidinium_carterae.2
MLSTTSADACKGTPNTSWGCIPDIPAQHTHRSPPQQGETKHVTLPIVRPKVVVSCCCGRAIFPLVSSLCGSPFGASWQDDCKLNAIPEWHWDGFAIKRAASCRSTCHPKLPEVAWPMRVAKQPERALHPEG